MGNGVVKVWVVVMVRGLWGVRRNVGEERESVVLAGEGAPVRMSVEEGEVRVVDAWDGGRGEDIVGECWGGGTTNGGVER